MDFADARRWGTLAAMTIDTQRWFRVHDGAFPAGARVDGTQWVHGWLAFEPLVTVRLVESPDDGLRAYTTQEEHSEKPVPLAHERRVQRGEANALLERCVATVRTRRYRLKVDDVLWEVDEYLDALEGLWLAAASLPAGPSFVRPTWLGAEVTGDPRFDTLALARSGVLPG